MDEQSNELKDMKAHALKKRNKKNSFFVDNNFNSRLANSRNSPTISNDISIIRTDISQINPSTNKSLIVNNKQKVSVWDAL